MSKDEQGRTALQVAAEFGCDNALTALRIHGADFDSPDFSGLSAGELLRRSHPALAGKMELIDQSKVSKLTAHRTTED
jgi:hypothetical protein